MTRMFVMEQTQQFEVMSTIGMLLAATSGNATPTTQKNVKMVMDNFRDTLGFGRWSNGKKVSTGRKEKTDAELLAHLDKTLGKGQK